MSVPIMTLLPIISIFIFFISAGNLIPPAFSALIAPIQKDHTTLQYTISIYLKTPLQPTNLLLDLGGSFSWLDCTRNYTSTTYHNIPCDTPLCDSLHSLACNNFCSDPPGPGCANNSCALYPENSVTRQVILAQAIVDAFALPTAIPSGQLGRIPDFIFSCSKTSLLKGLTKKVTGLAGLGRSNISIPAQISRAYSSPYLFALCLSGSAKAPGAAIFNTSGPYNFSPGIDLSKHLIYTPLLLNPVGFTQITYYLHPSDEYFIGVTSVRVNDKTLSLNQTLLSIDENGFGGTRISTVVPYTVLETSIYKAFTDAFVKESAAMNLAAAKPVKPFNFCYAATDVLTTRLGPGVPTVDLVMGSDDVLWRIHGANLMVKISRKGADLWCLGIVNGGVNPRTSIVIGGLQLEDNLLQFDVQSKRLGFSSSVLVHGTTCANFNFSGK